MMRFFVLLMLAFLIIPTPSYAYLDPGTGSMILQALAAGVVAVAIFWRNLVRSIKTFFGKTPLEAEKPPNAQDNVRNDK